MAGAGMPRDLDCSQFFIAGEWCDATAHERIDVENPATERIYTQVSKASDTDVALAVDSAKSAAIDFGEWEPKRRAALLESILAAYDLHRESLVDAVMKEMGSPAVFAKEVHTERPRGHLRSMIRLLREYEFEERLGSTALIRWEPIGVCGLITAWNWPLSLLMAKLAPALAAGCAVVIKPSEVAPVSTSILCSILRDAGTPAGVVNLIHGDAETGAALVRHPSVDMISFTGSTVAGTKVMETGAQTIKRVALELGGKSPNVILPDADLVEAVERGVMRCFANTGQSCQAPTRMLVHVSQVAAASAIAVATAEKVVVGDPSSRETTMGPLASRAQYDKVQRMIISGIDQGATLLTGGLGKPSGLSQGHYVRPTVFSDVSMDMEIAQQEIFGPVLSISAYGDLDQAVEMANGTTFGLAAYVESANRDAARNMARRLKAGRVYINGAPPEQGSPFGGYRRSGNGREGGILGLREFMESKAILGFHPV